MTGVRFMTFNLRRDIPADGANAWNARKEAAAGLVRDCAPHVLGTQEGLHHQLRDLDARLPGRYRRLGVARRGGTEDEFNAIYYDAERLRVLAHGDFWLSDRPHEPASATWGNRLPRMVTWARFCDLHTGRHLHVANTHLDHANAAARARGAWALAQRVPGAVLTGDFNEAPGGHVHATLLASGWQDCQAAHADEGDPAHTFHGFSGAACVRIDWVLAPAGARVLSHEVVRDRPGGVLPSDHFPVVAEVLIPQARRRDRARGLPHQLQVRSTAGPQPRAPSAGAKGVP